eukprot:Nitzschia sp. Nitz4//scaffold188_size43225//1742//2521//NITZ4_007341-RA/size43225-processed-gene-0.5-mRNA-1//1//CDS//3329539832//8655//frame0
MLLVDKEIGLVRYHGLVPYLQKQNLPQLSWFGSSKVIAPSTHEPVGTPASPTPSTSDPTNAISGQEPNHKTAQVAFMITSSMRQQLSQEMGYSIEQIKQMTPTQASLLLRHNIPPEEMADRLPKAEETYEQQRAVKDIPKQEPQPQKSSSVPERFSPQEAHQAANVSLSTEAASTPRTPESDSFHSDNSLSVETWNNVTWFEIVETKQIIDGKQIQRVGLYRDRSEAELAMQTRREIAASRSDTNLTYELRVAVDLELS